MTGASPTLGNCCDELRDAIEGEDFDPMFTISGEGVLYMTVGLVDLDDDEPGLVDHPMFFCPFCGTRQQTEEDVVSKVGPEDDEDDDEESDDTGNSGGDKTNA